MRPLGTLVVLALVVLAACTSSGSSSAATAGTSAGGATTLDNTTWNLTSIGGADIAADATPTLVFGTGGMVSGLAGCNNFIGTATVGEGTIEFGPLATTRMACADEAISQLETDYLAALDETATWTMEGDSLVLGGATELAYSKG
jgi:heat shock protein HslJ